MLNSIFFLGFIFFKKNSPIIYILYHELQVLVNYFSKISGVFFARIFFLVQPAYFSKRSPPYFVPPKRSCACPLNSGSCIPEQMYGKKELRNELASICSIKELYEAIKSKKRQLKPLFFFLYISLLL